MQVLVGRRLWRVTGLPVALVADVLLLEAGMEAVKKARFARSTLTVVFTAVVHVCRSSSLHRRVSQRCPTESNTLWNFLVYLTLKGMMMPVTSLGSSLPGLGSTP